MPPKQQKQPRERAVDRRSRLAKQRQARMFAKRFIIPALLVVLALVVAFFFSKYGLGAARTKPVA